MGQHLFQQIYFISLQKFRSQNLQKRDAQKKFNKHRLVKNGKKIIFVHIFISFFPCTNKKLYISWDDGNSVI